jgi:hypothetical protein
MKGVRRFSIATGVKNAADYAKIMAATQIVIPGE